MTDQAGNTPGPPREPADGAGGRWAAFAAAFGPAIAFLVLMLIFDPFGGVFELDPDEGNNLMKARLLADGHRLHGEVWSDQPPGFTYLLAGWLGLTGWNVEQGRLLVLLCSAVLMAALGHAARLTGGNAAALGACALLAGSFGYLRLSSSVMLAVPSLMFAMLSVCLALEHRRHRHFAWLAASAAAMALAVMVKLWTAALVPVALLAMVPGFVPGGWRRPTCWAIVFVAALTAIFPATVPLDQAAQLFSPHLDVRSAGDFHKNTGAFWGHLGDDAGIVLLAAAGAAVALARRRWIGLLPAAWAVLAIAVLAPHKPLWYHHHLLVSIPLCWSGGLAIGAIASRKWLKTVAQALTPRGDARAWAASAGAALPAWGPALPAVAGAALFIGHVSEIHRVGLAPSGGAGAWRDALILGVMQGLAPETRFVLTDRQIVPFRAGLRVPPDMAVTSLKRIWSGNLDEARVLEALEAHRPEQVLLSGRRIPLSPGLVGRLNQAYKPMYHDHSGGGLLVRNDLADRGLELLRQAAAANPGIWEVQLNLGNRLHEAGRAAQSMEAYRRVLEVLPRDEDFDPLREDLVEMVESGE